MNDYEMIGRYRTAVPHVESLNRLITKDGDRFAKVTSDSNITELTQAVSDAEAIIDTLAPLVAQLRKLRGPGSSPDSEEK